MAGNRHGLLILSVYNSNVRTREGGKKDKNKDLGSMLGSILGCRSAMPFIRSSNELR